MKPYKSPSVVAVFATLASICGVAGLIALIVFARERDAALILPIVSAFSGCLVSMAVAYVIEYLARIAHFTEHKARTQIPEPTHYGRL